MSEPCLAEELWLSKTSWGMDLLVLEQEMGIQVSQDHCQNTLSPTGLKNLNI